MAESSSSLAASASPTRYEVFLNFRGEDTRENFISHLYAALERKHIETYIDYRLQRGEEISPALQTAIEESKIYVLVFSENYAFSTWCLNELTKILDCKKRYGRDVIPVFYKVHPTIVRKQEERYKEAFEEHKLRFKEDMGKVQGWKDALTEAAGLSGWDSNLIRSEHILVEEIIDDILKKLNRYSVSYNQGIIGIEKHIEEIGSLLDLESPDIRTIGICGMGGMGKSTISEQLYHTLAVKFDSHSLVLDVQEKLQREGIHNIITKYRSELLKETSSPHLSYYNERLKRTKVLLILDDVTDSTLLNKLIGGCDRFGLGSRIIITSRDRQVLKNAGTDDIYELKELNFYDSLKLFNLHAFKQNSSKEITYMDLSIKVLRYAKGVPLALQSLGSLLYGRQKEEWESQLQKLEKGQDVETFNVLKLSYDGLDEEQKNIFLEIACFYRGHNEIVVVETLKDCGFSSEIGMDVLKDKCLISILDGRIVMHDLIQEMGQEIVRKECPQHPGKRSRLFKADEIHEILRTNKGVPLNFQSLKRLCFIDLSNCSSLTIFPFDLSEIKFLKKLRLSGCSKLENFPEIENTMEDLAVLLLDCTAIHTLPSSLYRLVGLQELSLRSCSNLEIIPSSIGRLTRLCKLDITYCASLQTFPSTIFKLKLRKLDLCGCFKLRTFPEIMEPTQTFVHIDLTKTLIKELPSSFGNLVKLRSLQLNSCSALESLPNSIVNLKHLCKLDCSGCYKLTEIPRHIGRLTSLVELSLSESGIVSLPESIAHLSSLKSLDLSDCKKLECIPHIPPFLKQLVALDCTSIRGVMLNSNSLVPNLSNSKEGFFRFHFTNAQQLDSGARANIEEDARLRMSDDAYGSVCFCFPGSAVPHWFPFRNEGPSVSINEDLSFCSDDKLIGFALCVVLGVLDTNDIKSRYSSFGYSLKFECDDDGTHIIPNNDVLNNYFTWGYSPRLLDKDHIFMWKFNLESLRRRGMNLRLCDARSFTFEISPYHYNSQWPDYYSVVNELKSVVKIKECGMCPLYSSGSNVAESSR
ncbi:TMV resistance protein N-like [Vigna radiata var. radiata]|uniref:ADP-ribosyl cyclase/cyclic ADP-ribose hydrolase n=1 Tax=Vigna radiata var. radiata TaxID=3916 RepID=A0A3Q0FE25_VIGRR|nr:TMV resistance protein N-like [Vigna radiata var. radiata]